LKQFLISKLLPNTVGKSYLTTVVGRRSKPVSAVKWVRIKDFFAKSQLRVVA